MRKRLRVAIGADTLLLAAKSGGGSNGGSMDDVSLTDFKINPAQTALSSGKVTFQVENTGASEHEFVVLRTDLPASEIPTKANGEANEDAAGLTSMGEVEGVESGGSGTLTLNLPAGRYLFLCNEPGHFAQGMFTFVTVK